MKWRKRRRLSLSPDRLRLVLKSPVNLLTKERRLEIERFLRKNLGNSEVLKKAGYFRYQFETGVFILLYGRGIEIDFQGKFWNLGNKQFQYSLSRKIIKKLNQLTGGIFHVTRVDIEQLFYSKVEEFLPLPRGNDDVWWSFIRSTPAYYENSDGILESFFYKSSRFQLSIYRKDIESKLKDSKPLTRFEVRILRSDACKYATELLYTQRGYKKFSSQVLRQSLKKKSVRLKNLNSDKKKWDRLEFWDYLMCSSVTPGQLKCPSRIRFSSNSQNFMKQFLKSIRLAKEADVKKEELISFIEANFESLDTNFVETYLNTIEWLKNVSK